MLGTAYIPLLSHPTENRIWVSHRLSSARTSMEWRENRNRKWSSPASFLQGWEIDVLDIFIIPAIEISLDSGSYIKRGKDRQQFALTYFSLQQWLTEGFHQICPKFWSCGRRCSVYCVCDHHSPSQALTHTSPAHLHCPTITALHHSSACSVLPPPPCPDLLFYQRELIKPCGAITLHSVPDPPETNTLGVLFTCPSKPTSPFVCVPFTVHY